MSIYLKRCDFCYEGIKNPMVCSRCKAASYCNKACQKAHWEDHKKLCCKDITILSNKEGEDLVSSLLEKTKKEVRKHKVQKWIAVGGGMVVSIFSGYYILTH